MSPTRRTRFERAVWFVLVAGNVVGVVANAVEFILDERRWYSAAAGSLAAAVLVALVVVRPA